MKQKLDNRVTELEQAKLADMIAKLFRAGVLDVRDGRFVALREDAQNMADGLNELHRRGMLKVAAS